MKQKILTAATASALAAMIAACGGGGGSSGSSSSSAAAQTYSINGTAATGAAYRGQVQLQDSSGSKFDCGSASDSGTYSCTLPLTAKAPFVVTITDTSNPEAQPMVSVSAEQPVAGQTTIININPLTDGIARTLVKGKVDELADASKFKDKVTEAAVKDLVDAMGVELGNLAKAAGVDKFDPIKTPMKTDGSGLDKVLDLTQVQVVVDDSGKASAVITTQINGKNYTLTITQTDSSTSSSSTSSTSSSSSSESLPSVDVIAADPISKLPAEAKAIGESFTACFATNAPRNWAAAGCKDVAALALPSYLNDGKNFVNSYAGRMTTTSTASGWDKAKVISTQLLYVDPEEVLGGVQLPQRAAVRFKLAIAQQDGSTLTKSFVEILTYTSGKWKIIGNQFKYPLSMDTSILHSRNVNQPAERSISSGFRFYIYGQDLKAVRVTGAGLPEKGLVFVPNTTVATDAFNLNNNYGEVVNLLINSTTSLPFGTGNLYSLTEARVGQDNSFIGNYYKFENKTQANYESSSKNTSMSYFGSAMSRAYKETKEDAGVNASGENLFNYTRATNIETDLSAFDAMPRYKFEYFNSNNELVAVQMLRQQSKPLTIKAAMDLPLSNLTSDTLDYLKWGSNKSQNQTEVRLSWDINPLAPSISSIQAQGSILAWNGSGTSSINVNMQFTQPTIPAGVNSMLLSTFKNCTGTCLSYLPWVAQNYVEYVDPIPSTTGTIPAGKYVGTRSFFVRYTRPDGVTVYNTYIAKQCSKYYDIVSGKEAEKAIDYCAQG